MTDAAGVGADASGTADPTAAWPDLESLFCPVGRRRRGPALEQAIYAAALSQLAENGLGALTMEGVAAAARTGKASLYRRWSSKEELILDALGCAMPAAEELDTSSGSLRDDLLTQLTRMAAFVSGPHGQIVRSLLGGAEPGGPLLEMVRTRLIEPRLDRLRHVIELAVGRGEARPGSATVALAQVGPAVAMHRFLLHGQVTADDVLEIVDSVVLPLLQCGS